MLMGAVALSVEAMLLVTCLPETLKKDLSRDSSISRFVKESWRDMGGPWNNLRVFATGQLRSLASIRFVHYTIASGGAALFFSWYRRHELDTLTMYTLGTAGGATAFICLLLVVRLVDWFGDLRGVWLPANILGLLYGTSIVLIPASHWQLSYIVFPLFGGSGAALAGFTPELLAKLVPPDVQGTFQTAKAFLFDLQRGLLVWPWLGLLIVSEDFPYPFDVLPIWIALVLGVITLGLTIRQLYADPRDTIRHGCALQEFWETPYATGAWYKKHGGAVVASTSTGKEIQDGGKADVESSTTSREPQCHQVG
jgi:hypothetical protein